jgi:DNA-binding MarR family transcriptional regulator
MSSVRNTDRSSEGAVVRLVAQSIALHEAAAVSLGLNPTDLRCLALIASEGNPTPGRLAEVSGLTSGAITGVMDRLEKAGYLTRALDPKDRRRQTLMLNEGRMRELSLAFEPAATEAHRLVKELGIDPSVETRYIRGLADAFAAEAGRLSVAARGGMVGDEYVVPLAGVTRAQLLLSSGAPRLSFDKQVLGQQLRMVAETAATRLRLSVGHPDERLVSARFEGPPPRVRHSDDGLVALRYPRRLVDPRARAAAVSLNPSAEWSVDIAGGITDLEGDIRKLRLAGIQLRGGVNHVDLSLPAADGAVRLSFAGGSSRLFLSRPRGTGIDLRVHGGVSHLEFDGRQLGSQSGGERIQSKGFDRAVGHYQGDIDGGVSHLKISEK